LLASLRLFRSFSFTHSFTLFFSWSKFRKEPIFYCKIEHTLTFDTRQKLISTKTAATTKTTRAMDSYPAADPIPDPEGDIDAQYTTLMEFLSNSREMRHTAKSSLKQALWSGAGALTGGLLMGPLGGLVGGVAGSLVGFAKSPNYDGAVMHLCKLDDGEKKALLTRVGQVLIAAGAAGQTLTSEAALRDALINYASQRSVREGLWNACLESLQT
jgi:hypothetical protein